MEQNSKLTELSIVIPIYKEAKNINNLWVKIKKNIDIRKFETIFVDDNSRDGTEEILKKISKKDKKVKFFIRKNKEKDLSRSCILGFVKSKYKNILVMDGDLQHDPKYIKKLINKYNITCSDIIVGCRDFYSKNNKGLNFVRTLISIFLIIIINIFLGKKTLDPMAGFFLFKKKIFLRSKHKFYKKGYKILADIIYTNKDKIIVNDVIINFKKRKRGKSKINLKVLIYLIGFIIKKIFSR
jgi:dolichol-phosphate mannosyltransferase